MRGPVVVCLLAAVVGPGVFAQSLPLNPTVRVLEKPQAIVPADCDEGLAPAAPRMPVDVAVAAPVEPRSVAPPPAADLRTRLRRVQTAAESGDYASFKSSLAEARSAVSGYPAGGEKQSASEVLQVYADLERLWDYGMTSSTGSFFDAASADGAIIAALRRYPEFPRAVADASMNIGGQTIYPTRETRVFLTDEAAKRLRSLGVRTPTRVVQETPAPRTVQPTPRATTTTPRSTTTTTTPRKTPSKSAATTPSRPRTETQPRTTTKAPAPQKQARLEPPSRPQPQPQPQPVKPQPQPVVPQPQPEPQPVTETTATTATTESATPATTETTSTATTDTTAGTDTSATTATAATESTATQEPAPATPRRGVNLPFAIILIAIGIAVLVLLFRSSD